MRRAAGRRRQSLRPRPLRNQARPLAKDDEAERGIAGAEQDLATSQAMLAALRQGREQGGDDVTMIIGSALPGGLFGRRWLLGYGDGPGMSSATLAGITRAARGAVAGIQAAVG